MSEIKYLDLCIWNKAVSSESCIRRGKSMCRIPLLGLQALIDNNLQLKLDPRRGTFVLSRTDGLSPLELLAFLGRKRD